jgi:hypothetical protein
MGRKARHPSPRITEVPVSLPAIEVPGANKAASAAIATPPRATKRPVVRNERLIKFRE